MIDWGLIDWGLIDWVIGIGIIWTGIRISIEVGIGVRIGVGVGLSVPSCSSHSHSPPSLSPSLSPSLWGGPTSSSAWCSSSEPELQRCRAVMGSWVGYGGFMGHIGEVMGGFGVGLMGGIWEGL